MPTAEQCCYIIINAIDPYKYDLNQIMALPAGFPYRNRFDRRWVSEPAQTLFSTLKGKRCLLVIRDKTTDLLVPIRYARVLHAQRVGRIYYIEYALDGFVEFDSLDGLRKRQLEDFNREFAVQHQTLITQKGPEQDFSPLVFLSMFVPDIRNQNFSAHSITDRELETWGNILDLIRPIAAYRDVEFVKVIDLRTLDGSPCPSTEGRFLLHTAKTFALRLFQFVPSPSADLVTPHDIEINTDENHATILRRRQRAVGKYDVLTFFLKTADRVGRERSFLEIVHVPGTYALPSIYLPLEIEPLTDPRKAVVKIVLATLTAGLAIWPQLLTVLPVELARTLATMLFVLVIADKREIKYLVYQKLIRLR